MEISFGGDAFDGDEVIEGFAGVTMVDDANTAGVGENVLGITSKRDDVAQIGTTRSVLGVGELAVFAGHFEAEQENFATEGVTGEIIGKVLKTIVRELTKLDDRIVERGDGRDRDNYIHDTVEVAVSVVAKIGDLFFGIDLTELEEM